MSRYGWNQWNGAFNGFNVNGTGYINAGNVLTNSLSVRPDPYNLSDNMVKAIFLGR